MRHAHLPRGALTVSGGAAATRPPSTVVDQATHRRGASPSTGPTSSPSPTTSSRSSTRSPRPSMPATSRRPRRPTARRACRGSGSSRSPSCSPTSTPRSTPARTTTRPASTTPGSPATTSSRSSCYANGTTDGTAELTAGAAGERRRAADAARDARDRPAGHDPGRRRPHRRGRPVEDDRRGGPLLEARPLVDRPEPRGLGQDRRHPAPDPRRRSTRTTSSSLDDAYASVDDDHRQVRRPVERASRPSTRSAPADLKAMQAGLANLSELLSELSGRLGPGGLSRHLRLMDDAKVLSRRRLPRRFCRRRARPRSPVASRAGSGRWRSAGPPPAAQASGTEPGYIPFDGPHQAGIVLPTRPQTAAIFVALDAVVGSKPELATALAELTARSRQLTAGLAPDPGDPLFPPPESGILGPDGRTVRPDHHGRVRGVAVRRAVRPGRPHPAPARADARLPQRPDPGRARPTATCSSRSAPPTRRAASTRCAT